MRFTILVFLAASVGFGLKEQPLWMRCIVLAVRAGDSFRPTGFVVVHTPPCYVSTISRLVVGVVVSVMDQLGFAPLQGDKL